jgi:pimeloyl-ACP methyl ester carboxylesterase
MGRRAHFDPDAVDIRAAAAHLAGRPCLFVANSGDRRMPPEIAFELKAAAGPQAKVLIVPGQSHGEAYRDGTAAYETAVTEVLSASEKGAPVRMAGR